MNTAPTESEIRYIEEALKRFNTEKVGEDGHTPLNVVEYDESGAVIGGILGGTYWGWMHVDILWVDKKHRRKGIGDFIILPLGGRQIQKCSSQN